MGVVIMYNLQAKLGFDFLKSLQSYLLAKLLYLYIKVVWKEGPGCKDPSFSSTSVVIGQVGLTLLHYPVTLLLLAAIGNWHHTTMEQLEIL